MRVAFGKPREPMPARFGKSKNANRPGYRADADIRKSIGNIRDTYHYEMVGMKRVRKPGPSPKPGPVVHLHRSGPDSRFQNHVINFHGRESGRKLTPDEKQHLTKNLGGKWRHIKKRDGKTNWHESGYEIPKQHLHKLHDAHENITWTKEAARDLEQHTPDPDQPKPAPLEPKKPETTNAIGHLVLPKGEEMLPEGLKLVPASKGSFTRWKLRGTHGLTDSQQKRLEGMSHYTNPRRSQEHTRQRERADGTTHTVREPIYDGWFPDIVNELRELFGLDECDVQKGAGFGVGHLPEGWTLRPAYGDRNMPTLRLDVPDSVNQKDLQKAVEKAGGKWARYHMAGYEQSRRGKKAVWTKSTDAYYFVGAGDVDPDQKGKAGHSGFAGHKYAATPTATVKRLRSALQNAGIDVPEAPAQQSAHVADPIREGDARPLKDWEVRHAADEKRVAEMRKQKPKGDRESAMASAHEMVASIGKSLFQFRKAQPMNPQPSKARLVRRQVHTKRGHTQTYWVRPDQPGEGREHTGHWLTVRGHRVFQAAEQPRVIADVKDHDRSSHLIGRTISASTQNQFLQNLGLQERTPARTAVEKLAGDRAKYLRVKKLDRALPEIHANIAKGLRAGDMLPERVKAAAMALMFKANLRVGNPESADYGVAGATTLMPENVSVGGNTVVLTFVGKSGVQWKRRVTHKALAASITECLKNAEPGQPLFRYRTKSGALKPLRDVDIRAIMKRHGILPKDLRTWAATVKAFHELKKRQFAAGDNPKPKDLRQRIKEVCEQVAKDLGHTPAMAKNSYIAPILFRLYEEDQGRLSIRKPRFAV